MGLVTEIEGHVTLVQRCSLVLDNKELGMSVNIPADVEAIVNSHVQSGEYRSAGEMISAAVRLLDRRKREKERQVEKLRSMLQEAVDELESGQWIDGETAFEEVLRELEETGTVRP
jgi:putative addiction module CopG family antidote